MPVLAVSQTHLIKDLLSQREFNGLFKNVAYFVQLDALFPVVEGTSDPNFRGFGVSPWMRLVDESWTVIEVGAPFKVISSCGGHDCG
jgi:hypothetical protein